MNLQRACPNTSSVSSTPTKIGDISSKFDLNLGQLQSSFSEISTNIVSKLGSYVSDGAINIVSSSINIVTNFVIVLFVSIYLLKDMDKIREEIKFFFKKKSKRTYNYIKTLDMKWGMIHTLLSKGFGYIIVIILSGFLLYYLKEYFKNNSFQVLSSNLYLTTIKITDFPLFIFIIIHNCKIKSNYMLVALF